MGDEEEPLLIEYRAKNGESLIYDISASTLLPFGFNYADRVDTPKGPGTVIGVREGCLWIHCDSDQGASFWDNGKSYQTLRKIGISLLEETQPMVIDLTEKNGVYKLKRISFKDRNLNIILQNENGPCPLISISNVLALRGDITINPSGEPDTSRSIDIDVIKTLLTELLYKRYDGVDEETKKKVEKAIQQLPNLQMGMDVNFGFITPDSFEKSDQSLIFDLLDVKLVHGWLVDPIDAETHSVIGNNTYNDLMNKLVALDQPPPSSNSASNNSSNNASNNSATTTSPVKAPQSPSPSHAPTTSPSPSRSPQVSHTQEAPASPKPVPPQSPQRLPSSQSLTTPTSEAEPSAENKATEEPKKAEEVKPPTPRDYHDGEIINSFLRITSSQLTAHGLNVLQNTLREEEYLVFFRNNHFSTITRHDGQLYILVTDIGYEKERIIVWDLLNTVDGDSLFVTGDFKPTDDEKNEEIVNTLEIMGWTRKRIEECMKSAPREKLVNADDAISYLAQILQGPQTV